MSYFDDPYDEEDDQDPEGDSSCDYGAEFCEDPQARAMGLCTTECHLYFDMVKAQEEELDHAMAAWEWNKALENFYFWLLLVGLTEILLFVLIWSYGWARVQEGLTVTSAPQLVGFVLGLGGLFVVWDIFRSWRIWTNDRKKEAQT